MNDETKSAQAEGEALPASGGSTGNLEGEAPLIVSTGYDVRASEYALCRIESAIEHWYATHFHAAAISGRAPITAEEKASLLQHVTEALTPKE